MDGGGWERAEELEAVLRQLMTAAAEFLDLVDEAYDLDDPETPCQRTADALEDALAAARTVLPDEP
jgi:hypothetical protein